MANRGEISVRIARGCRERGLETVAIYSDADAGAPHVSAADRAMRVGPARASESYLNVDAILRAARESGADAIHPGYGFLSENAGFAEACARAGLTFIGPPASVIARMGSKTAARAAATAAGVPVVPGAVPVDQTPAAIADAVRLVGFPALIKASAGGGGKGMRVVRCADEVAEAVESASREATRAFSDGAVYVERLIERPRHIEVQILGDVHGNVVHLFERDCSLQRRHQKVIEETPAPNLTPSVRARITAAAVAAARGVGYVNAGTVEFILEGDGDAAEFYFLEMNTRLQVEHPVTELVTGRDLVHAQLRVAEGEPLWFTQADVAQSGHAIECRVYAEDALRGLLPQTGTLFRYREPSGDGIRVDSGVAEGQLIGVDYDPMLAKVIVHAGTREAALARMDAALRDFVALGVRHNVPFLLKLIALDDVRASRIDTGLIERRLGELAAAPAAWLAAAAEAVAKSGLVHAAMPAMRGASRAKGRDPWETISW
ncbi:MAG: ATP-grasp domain-containing protein [Acidobacteria bacterium]|nr:MAG: ATP-grasp domain-containing protein [Acidobacteriota bacterium]